MKKKLLEGVVTERGKRGGVGFLRGIKGMGVIFGSRGEINPPLLLRPRLMSGRNLSFS